MEEAWYIGVTYENAKELVKENLVNTVAAFIASGYWLKYIRDSREYEKDGYQSLWDCAEVEFGLKISEASRAMSMNDKYSIDGNTPYMAESYKQYNKSQLQEMLTMSDEQMEQVTPDMTVREIRGIKNPKAEDSEEKLGMLKEFISNFMKGKYVYVELYHAFPEAAGIDMEGLKEVFEGKLDSAKLSDFIMLGDEVSELVNADTGEILATYSSNTVIEMISSYFVKLREIKDVPMLPKIKGLMDTPYCCVCGSSLNPPDAEHPDMVCDRCGQAVDWSKYIKEFCDVAKDETYTVDTECEEKLTESIYTEIEVEPEAEAEEALSIEFDTNELLQELDSEAVIDGEYRVIEDTRLEENEVSAYGLPKTKYPEGSLFTTEGCGNKYACFSCAQDCTIRQKSRYCCDAPLGNPFDCTTMNELASLKNDIGNECQFINLDIAEHTSIGHPVPCCKNCQINDCGYRCRRAVEVLPELKDAEECVIKPEQPEFPVFKNNEQRKAWLEDVEAWGLWYEDPNIQARYYKYDIPDGSRLIAVKYRYTCPPWMSDYKEYAESDGSYRDAHYHMIYSEEYKKIHKNEYENYYTHSTVSISTLIDFIKELAKRVNESE